MSPLRVRWSDGAAAATTSVEAAAPRTARALLEAAKERRAETEGDDAATIDIEGQTLWAIAKTANGDIVQVPLDGSEDVFELGARFGTAAPERIWLLSRKRDVARELDALKAQGIPNEDLKTSMDFVREVIAAILPAYDSWVNGAENLSSVESAFQEVATGLEELKQQVGENADAVDPAFKKRVSGIEYDLDGEDVMDVAQSQNGADILDSVRASLHKRVSKAVCYLSFVSASLVRQPTPASAWTDDAPPAGLVVPSADVALGTPSPTAASPSSPGSGVLAAVATKNGASDLGSSSSLAILPNTLGSLESATSPATVPAAATTPNSVLQPFPPLPVPKDSPPQQRSLSSGGSTPVRESPAPRTSPPSDAPTKGSPARSASTAALRAAARAAVAAGPVLAESSSSSDLAAESTAPVIAPQPAHIASVPEPAASPAPAQSPGAGTILAAAPVAVETVSKALPPTPINTAPSPAGATPTVASAPSASPNDPTATAPPARTPSTSALRIAPPIPERKPSSYGLPLGPGRTASSAALAAGSSTPTDPSSTGATKPALPRTSSSSTSLAAAATSVASPASLEPAGPIASSPSVAAAASVAAESDRAPAAATTPTEAARAPPTAASASDAKPPLTRTASTSKPPVPERKASYAMLGPPPPRPTTQPVAAAVLGITTSTLPTPNADAVHEAPSQGLVRTASTTLATAVSSSPAPTPTSERPASAGDSQSSAAAAAKPLLARTPSGVSKPPIPERKPSVTGINTGPLRTPSSTALASGTASPGPASDTRAGTAAAPVAQAPGVGEAALPRSRQGGSAASLLAGINTVAITTAQVEVSPPSAETVLAQMVSAASRTTTPSVAEVTGTWPALSVVPPVVPPPSGTGQDAGLVVDPLFLERDGRTKRSALTATKATAVAALRRLFFDRFDQTPLPATSQLYVRDPAGFVDDCAARELGTVFYELEALDGLQTGCTIRLFNPAGTMMGPGGERANVTLALDTSSASVATSLAALASEVAQLRSAVTGRTAPSSSSAAATLAVPASGSAGAGAARAGSVGRSRASSSVSGAAGPKAGLATVQQLRTELGALHAATEELRKTTKLDLAKAIRLANKGHLAASAAHGPSRQLTVERDYVLEQSRTIADKLDELKTALETMKVDITRRKAKPSVAHLHAFGFELKTVGELIAKLDEYVRLAKPRWKKLWEKEVSDIVNEQKAMKEQEKVIGDYDDLQHDLTEFFEQLSKVAQQLESRKPQALHFIAPDDGLDLAPKDRKESLLAAIKAQNADASKRRLEAMAAAEKVRRLRMLVHDDPFADELSTFVGARKFSRTIGIENVERERERKDWEIFHTGGQ